MAYLIDTNIAIHAGGGTEAVVAKFVENSGSIIISVLSLVELQRGLVKTPTNAAVRRAQLDALLRNIPVIPFDQAAAEAYRHIIAQLGWVRGRDFDRMIAAHAISTQSVLVTANEADFHDVPGLKIENWASA